MRYWMFLVISSQLFGNSVGFLRYEVENVQSELLNCQEKMDTQEALIERLQEELVQLREKVKEPKPKEEGNHSVKKDLITLKEHVMAMQQEMTWQKNEMDQLKGALRVLFESLGVQVPNDSWILSGTRSYKVVEGDSLGKIAQKEKTTVKALKELNQLKNEKIFVGQTLLLP